MDFLDSKDYYKTLFYNSASPTCVFDINNGNILMVNKSISLLLGEDEESLQKKNIYFYIQDNADQTFRDYLYQFIDEENTTSYQSFIIKENRETLSVSIKLSLIDNGENQWIQACFLDNNTFFGENKESKELLSETVLELNRLKKTEEVLTYIPIVLHKFLPKSIVVSAKYLEKEKRFVMHDSMGIDFDLIPNLTQKDIFDIKIRPIEFEKEQSHFFVDLEKIQKHHNIYADISKTNYQLAQNIFNFQKIYSARLYNKEKIFGAVLLLTLESDFLRQNEFIELFMSQVLLVLERIYNEKKLIAAKNKAEESDQLKLAFLSNMSHEIRTPMSALLGFSDLLVKEDNTEEEKLKYSNLIQRAGGILMKIIDDIIDVSKIELNQLKVEEKEFSLHDLMNEIYYYYSNKLKKEKSEIVFHLDDESDENIIINSDEYRLRQILVNLLNNAIKFTEKGTIRLRFYKKGKFVHFHVKDTGIGIPKDKQNVIFERFRKTDDSKENLYAGNGLGLSISKHLAYLLGGDLLVNSSYKNGAEFILVIATNRLDTFDNKKKTIIKPIGDINIDWEDKLIYVAEDELSNYQLLEAYLKTSKAQLKHFENGQDLLKAVQKKKPDLILLDIKMPILNGYETVKILKKKYPTVRVVAQTAYAMAEEKQKAMDAGCDDFVTKPIKKNILLYKMSKYLNPKK